MKVKQKNLLLSLVLVFSLVVGVGLPLGINAEEIDSFWNDDTSWNDDAFWDDEGWIILETEDYYDEVDSFWDIEIDSKHIRWEHGYVEPGRPRPNIDAVPGGGRKPSTKKPTPPPYVPPAPTTRRTTRTTTRGKYAPTAPHQSTKSPYAPTAPTAPPRTTTARRTTWDPPTRDYWEPDTTRRTNTPVTNRNTTRWTNAPNTTRRTTTRNFYTPTAPATTKPTTTTRRTLPPTVSVSRTTTTKKATTTKAPISLGILTIDRFFVENGVEKQIGSSQTLRIEVGKTYNVKTELKGYKYLKLKDGSAPLTGEMVKEGVKVQLLYELGSEPVINAKSLVVVDKGQTFDPKDGVTAYDKEDGDLTSSVVIVTNNVNVQTPGSYKVDYSVKDADGQEATATTKVIVIDKETIEKKVGDSVSSDDFIGKIIGIPEGTTITPLENIDTSHPNEGEVTVMVTTPDGDSFVTKVPFIVKQTDEAVITFERILVEGSNAAPFETKNVDTKLNEVYNFEDDTKVDGLTYAGLLTGSAPLAGTVLENKLLVSLLYLNNPPFIRAGGLAIVEQGTAFDAKAGVTAEDYEDGDITNKIVVKNEIDTSVLGLQEVKYEVEDSRGEKAERVKPVLVVKKNVTEFKKDEPTNPDSFDGSLDGIPDGTTITPTETIDTSKPHEGTTTVVVTTPDGNTATIEIPYIVVPAPDQPEDQDQPTTNAPAGKGESPVLNVGQNKIVDIGSTVNVMDGVTANDKEDGNLTDKVKPSGTVDTAQLGKQPIGYSVTDSDGNTSTDGKDFFVVKKTTIELELGDDTPSDLSDKISGLPEGSKVTPIEEIDTSKEHKGDVPVLITMPDGSTIITTIPFIIKDKGMPLTDDGLKLTKKTEVSERPIKAGTKLFYTFEIENVHDRAIIDIRITDAKLGIYGELIKTRLEPGQKFVAKYPKAYVVTNEDVARGFVDNEAEVAFKYEGDKTNKDYGNGAKHREEIDQIGTIYVTFIDVMTGKELKAREVLVKDQAVGTSYSFTAPEIDGYKYQRLAAGSMALNGQVALGEGTISLLYVEAEKTIDSYVYIQPIDKDNNKIGEPKLVASGVEGEDYDVKVPNLDGYTFKGLKPGSAPLTGKLKKGDTVIEAVFEKDQISTDLEVVVPDGFDKSEVKVTFRNKDTGEVHTFAVRKDNSWKLTIELPKGDYEVTSEDITGFKHEIEGEVGKNIAITYKREVESIAIEARFVNTPQGYKLPDTVLAAIAPEGNLAQVKTFGLNAYQGYMASFDGYKDMGYEIRLAQDLKDFTAKSRVENTASGRKLVLELVFTGEVTANNVANLPATGENLSMMPIGLILSAAGLVIVKVLAKRK